MELSRRAVIAGLLAVPSVGFACGWDKDTLRDEIQRQPTLYDLVTGQLPTHSDAWYEHTIRGAQARLALDPGDLGAHDDQGMALAHLGRFDEAEVVLLAAEKLAPDRYETLSNLGVLRKKQGQLEAGAALLARAIAQKPEGHLGIGDWYVHDVRWRASAHPDACFLGVPYADVLPAELDDPYACWRFVSPLAIEAAGRLKLPVPESAFSLRYTPPTGPLGEAVTQSTDRLHRLLRYDRTLPDALLVFGDTLVVQRDFNLALIAYGRAHHLKHPRLDVLEQRIACVLAHWREVNVGLADLKAVLDEATAQEARAQRWVKAFKEHEALAVARGETPTFEETEASLVKRGTQRAR